MEKKDKLKPSKKTKKKYRNNLFAFSFLTALLTFGLVELIFLLFFEVSGFGIDQIHMLYIVPALFLLIPMLINLGFKSDFDNFAKIEKSLKQVADGDFSVRIPTEKGGAFEESFNSFNKMVEELEQNKVLKDDFIHNFSHEFKTPIASIKGFADLLLEEDLSIEDQKRYLQIISSEAERLTNLSENALFVGKINTETIVKNKQVFDIGEQVKNCVVLLDGQITQKNIEITADIDNFKIYSSKELLQEVWLNVIGNAIKFTNSYGQIEISVKRNQENAQVIIKDNGIGIAKGDLDKIFAPYYQIDTSHKQVGFGLGLSIVKRVVDLCEGTIGVESELGKGTTFTINIPLDTSADEN